VRRVLVAAAAAALLATPVGAVPRAQVIDPANDANGGTYWAGDPDTVTPAGSQAYADVTAVRFATTRTTKRIGRRSVMRVTGISVTMALGAAPVPPADATGIYRVFTMGPRCIVGIEHYTRPLPDTAQPRTAVFDTCRGSLRRTPLAAAVVKGATITWAVPLTAFPKDTKIGVGTTLTNLHFEVYLASQASCARSAPGAEQPPCAVLLDTTPRRSGSFVIR
jgi:hypothetical protein